jgi:hypothetical protein
MSSIIRSMLRDIDGPIVGSDSNMLGVRIPPHPQADVHPDSAGNVHARGGGLSVNEDWKRMHLNHIPARFSNIVKKARGSDKKSLWRLGEVPFSNGQITEELELRITGANHGLIEPAKSMQIGEFQQRLGETKPLWSELIPES